MTEDTQWKSSRRTTTRGKQTKEDAEQLQKGRANIWASRRCIIEKMRWSCFSGALLVLAAPPWCHYNNLRQRMQDAQLSHRHRQLHK